MSPILIHLLLITILIIVTKSEFLQLVKQYSYNPRNKHVSNNSFPAYDLEGDASITPKGFQLTNNKSESYGRVITKGYLNTSQFEYHLQLKMNDDPSLGSMFGIWFFNNSTDSNDTTTTSKSFFGFAKKYTGVGIVGVTFPSNNPDKITTRISLIPYPDVEHYDIKEKPSDHCTGVFNQDKFQINIKYSNEMISVTYQNKRDLNNYCLSSMTKLFNDKEFKIAITAYNGMVNDVQFQDAIEVLKLSLINKDKGQADTIGKFNLSNMNEVVKTNNESIVESITTDNNTEANTTVNANADVTDTNTTTTIINSNNKTVIIDLVEKYYNDHTNQLQSNLPTIDNLNKEIDNTIDYLSKVQVNQNNNETINFKEVYSSLNQLNTLLTNLTVQLNKTNDKVINGNLRNHDNDNRTQEEKSMNRLSNELDVLLDKWTQIQERFQENNKTREDIENNITMLEESLSQIKNMQALIGDSINKKVIGFTKDIDKKIESDSLYHYIIIGAMGVGVVLMLLIYQKLKLKQKQS